MIIVYKSNTGHTKEYALMLAEALKIPAFPINHVPGYHKGDDIIYLGWLLAGAVSGLRTAQRKFNVRCVVATGMTAESSEQEAFVHDKCKLPAGVPVFYLQSGYDAKKLKGIYKLMMKVKTPQILARYKGKTDAEKKMDATYRMVTEGYSVVDEAHLARVIEWAKR